MDEWIGKDWQVIFYGPHGRELIIDSFLDEDTANAMSEHHNSHLDEGTCVVKKMKSDDLRYFSESTARA